MQERHTGPARAMPRRLFLKVVGIAGGALLVAGGGLATWIGRLLPAPLVRSSFAPRVGDTFQVQSGAALVALKLVDIVAAPASAQPQPADAAEQSFGLSFRGPAEPPLAQGTYEFAHGRLGSFPLFIVPMASTQGARYYEAIFNRQQA